MSIASHISDEDVARRILTYIFMVEKALSKAKESFRGSDREAYILNLAELYLKDSKYYFDNKDYITSLSCISYAEGLLDALRILGITKFEWKRETPKRVLVGGTFDIIHVGHIRYLKEASRLGLVYAIVATDNNVKKVKGREPILPQDQRYEIVSSLRYVYKALLGHEEDPLRSVENVKPNVIVLGPDQPIDESWLKKELEHRNLSEVEIVRLPRRIGPRLASSSNIIREILRRYCPCK